MDVFEEFLNGVDSFVQFDGDLLSGVATNRHHHTFAYITRTKLYSHRHALA